METSNSRSLLDWLQKGATVKEDRLKFIAGKISPNDKTQYSTRYQKTAAGKTNKHQYAYILSPEGNCDPVVSDPPPDGGD